MIKVFLLGIVLGAFIGVGITALVSVQGYEDGYRQAVMDMKHVQKVEKERANIIK